MITASEQIASFVGAIFEPEDQVEVRFLPSGVQGYIKASTLSGTKVMARSTKRNEAGENVYFGVNPRKRKGGAAEDVALARCLFVDFDEIDNFEAMRQIGEACLPLPTVVLGSGHGIHAYWRLEEPITDLSEWTLRQKALIAAVSSDPAIHDPPRVMRLPGYLNTKSEPFVLCELLEVTRERVYPLCEFPTHIPDVSGNGQMVVAGRNDAMTRFGGGARKRGLSGIALEDVMDDENRRRFPSNPLDRSEISVIRKSLERYPTEAQKESATVRLDDICMEDITPEEIEWLWPYRIPKGKVSIIAGMQGLGKSFLTLDIAARISNGGSWPDIPSRRIERGRVLLLNLEDALSDTVRPRLDHMKADLSMILSVRGVKEVDGSGSRMFNVGRDIEMLDKRIGELGDVKLLVIDPLTAYLGERLDIYRDNEVRVALEPLGALAEKHKVAVLAVMHLRKSQSDHAIYKVLGSIAFTAFTRTTWFVASDPDDTPDGRVMLSGKMNYARPAPSRTFKIVDPGLVEWGEGTELTADDALSGMASPDEGPTKIAKAVEFILELLKDGPIRVSDAKRAAKATDISDITFRRAREKLGVTAKPEGGVGSVYFWSLPVDQPTSARVGV